MEADSECYPPELSNSAEAVARTGGSGMLAKDSTESFRQIGQIGVWIAFCKSGGVVLAPDMVRGCQSIVNVSVNFQINRLTMSVSIVLDNATVSNRK